MFHFQDVSIKAKLYGLAILSMVGLASVLALAHYVITTYVVGGTVCPCQGSARRTVAADYFSWPFLHHSAGGQVDHDGPK